MGEHYLKQAQSYSTYARSLIDSYFKESDLVKSLELMKEEINENNYSSPSVFQGALWFDNMTQYIDILNIIQESLASRISEVSSYMWFYVVKLHVLLYVGSKCLTILRNTMMLNSLLHNQRF